MRSWILSLTLVLAGCASTSILQEATADEIGVPAEEIKIREKIKIVHDIMWKARHGEQEFRCESVCADTKCSGLDKAETFCEDLTFEEVE